MKTKQQIENEISYGEIYTLEEFFQEVKIGGFIPYDGFGFFHDGENETSRSVWSSDLSLLELKHYPYVCWYNK